MVEPIENMEVFEILRIPPPVQCDTEIYDSVSPIKLLHPSIGIEMEFKFNFDKLLSKAAEKAKKHIDGVTIKLPFISFSVKPTDIEKKVARELLVRLPDKRVLSSKECCDNCIDNSLASLQEIRNILVEAQVKLTDFHDGGLYLLVELMAEGVRQFITFEERLRVDQSLKDKAQRPDFYRPRDIQREYFEVLEQLRFHMHSCLTQVSTIADMETPKIESYLKANDEWLLSLYHEPAQLIVSQGVTSDCGVNPPNKTV